MARIITVTSGKGGVGKSNISINLAVDLARRGHRPCIFDADLGLANINILLGLRPVYDLEDVISGEKRLEDIMLQDSSGITIIPGGTGIEKLTHLDNDQLSRLITACAGLKGFDFLIFDTSAGISRDVLSFCIAAGEAIVVIVPEPTSLTDGYALLKVLSLNGYRRAVKVVVNQAQNERIAQMVFEKFNAAVRKYLPLETLFLGGLPSDEGVAEAVARQRPFVTLYPEGRAAAAVGRLVVSLLDAPAAVEGDGGLAAFWNNYAQIVSGPLRLPHKKTEQPPQTAAPVSRPASAADAPGETPLKEPLMVQQIVEALNRLTAATTEIGRQLGEMRQVLKQPPSDRSDDPIPSPNHPEPPVLKLDFEAYAEGKRKNTQGELR